MIPKVSILVAVYNAEAFLQACLDSLIGQSYRNIQVICIDDASTDNSLKILQDYAARDNRIEVLHLEENRGQAHARNCGLQRVSGDYVCMVDADDWLSTDAIEQVVAAFDEQTDCVLFSLVYQYATHASPYPMQDFDVLTGEEAFRLSLTWQIHGLYAIRAHIHQQHPYDETCRLYSDDNTTRIHYLHSRLVCYCTGVYHYRQHSASTTHQYNVRRFDYLRANESMRQQMMALKVDHSLLAEYENHRWLNLIDVYMFYHVHGNDLSEDDRRYGLRELRRTWATIDRQALNKETTAKFGYRPCSSWRIFRLQEWLYFTLRGFLGKNN